MEQDVGSFADEEPRYVDVIRDRYARFVGNPDLAAHPEGLRQG